MESDDGRELDGVVDAGLGAATVDELVRIRYCFDVQKGIKRMG